MDNQPEEKKDIPTPPPSKVNIRTMHSDIKSIQESGGQIPQPYTTEINQKTKKETAVVEEVSFQPSELEPNVPGYVGPEETVFQPDVSVAPLPPKRKSAQTEEKPESKKKTSKVLIIILIISALTAIVLGINIIQSKFY